MYQGMKVLVLSQQLFCPSQLDFPMFERVFVKVFGSSCHGYTGLGFSCSGKSWLDSPAFSHKVHRAECCLGKCNRLGFIQLIYFGPLPCSHLSLTHRNTLKWQPFNLFQIIKPLLWLQSLMAETLLYTLIYFVLFCFSFFFPQCLWKHSMS